MWVSFPRYINPFSHHTESQMSVDETCVDPKLSTSHRISNVCWRNMRWLEAFHITQNLKCLLTKHSVTRSFPRCIKNHDISLLSTVHTIQYVFRGALITTISSSCPHNTQYLQLQYLWLHNYQIKNIDVNYHKQSM